VEEKGENLALLHKRTKRKTKKWTQKKQYDRKKGRANSSLKKWNHEGGHSAFKKKKV